MKARLLILMLVCGWLATIPLSAENRLVNDLGLCFATTNAELDNIASLGAGSHSYSIDAVGLSYKMVLTTPFSFFISFNASIAFLSQIDGQDYYSSGYGYNPELGASKSFDFYLEGAMGVGFYLNKTRGFDLFVGVGPGLEFEGSLVNYSGYYYGPTSQITNDFGSYVAELFILTHIPITNKVRFFLSFDLGYGFYPLVVGIPGAYKYSLLAVPSIGISL